MIYGKTSPELGNEIFSGKHEQLGTPHHYFHTTSNIKVYTNPKETRGDISTIDMRRDGIQKGNRHEKEKSNKEEVFTRFSHTVNIEYH